MYRGVPTAITPAVAQPMKLKPGTRASVCPFCGHTVRVAKSTFTDATMGIKYHDPTYIKHDTNGAHIQRSLDRTPCRGSGARAGRVFDIQEEA